MRIAALVVGISCLPACLVPAGSRPTVDLSLDAATQYNHRGMPQNDTGVLQPAAAIALPAAGDGQLSITSWGNLDLRDDTGDAWFPDGNAGRFSEIDFIGAYAKRFGHWDTRFGAHNYVLPKGDQFPFGERGATVELFGRAEYDLGGNWFPFGELRVDVDEADGYYAFAGLLKSIPIDEALTFEAEGWIGYADEDEAAWLYGLAEEGFADARITAKLFYQLNSNTRLNGQVAYSTMVDSTLRDWFEGLDIEPDNLWASAGITWSY